MLSGRPAGRYHGGGCGRPAGLDSLNRSECGISVKEYVLSVEALETLPAGTKPSKVNDIAPPITCGSEGRRKSKRSTIFRERTRKGSHQLEQHRLERFQTVTGNCLRGSGANMGFPKRADSALKRNDSRKHLLCFSILHT